MFSWFTKTTEKLKLIILKLETLYERSQFMSNELVKLRQEIDRNREISTKAVDLIVELTSELEKAKSELSVLKAENTKLIPELTTLVAEQNNLLEEAVNLDVATTISVVPDSEVSVTDFIKAEYVVADTANTSVYLP